MFWSRLLPFYDLNDEIINFKKKSEKNSKETSQRQLLY